MVRLKSFLATLLLLISINNLDCREDGWSFGLDNGLGQDIVASTLLVSVGKVVSTLFGSGSKNNLCDDSSQTFNKNDPPKYPYEYMISGRNDLIHLSDLNYNYDMLFEDKQKCAPNSRYRRFENLFCERSSEDIIRSFCEVATAYRSKGRLDCYINWRSIESSLKSLDNLEDNINWQKGVKKRDKASREYLG